MRAGFISPNLVSNLVQYVHGESVLVVSQFQSQLIIIFFVYLYNAWALGLAVVVAGLLL
jgi:hypothetical protein